nr:MAG TPA: hypothetical protein [Caudoviricetes sp.]
MHLARCNGSTTLQPYQGRECLGLTKPAQKQARLKLISMPNAGG